MAGEKRQRGRPKGSYGWTPEKWGNFWDDVHTAMVLLTGTEEKPRRRPSKSAIARWLCENCPEKYGRDPDTLRQILQAHGTVQPTKTHGTGEKYRTMSERDAINAAVWKRLLGEEKT